MKQQRITLSDAAVADILEQADWYESQADSKLAERWENVVTATLLRVLENPRTGSLCRFKSEELRDVRERSSENSPSIWSFIDFARKNCSFFALFTVARDLESLF